MYGVVYDSLARGPLAGATVQLVRAGDLLEGRAASTDAVGAFRIAALAPGRYLVAFEHPLLDLLGVEVPPRLVALGPGSDTVRVDLGMPDLGRMRPVVCGNAQAVTDSTGLLAGRVRDATDDAPVADATIVLTWSELAFGAGGVHIERRRVPVPAGPDGRYIACGVPTGVEIAASAAAPGRASGAVALQLPVRGFARRDFALGETAAGAPGAAAGAMSEVGVATRDTTTAHPRAGDAPAPGAARVAAPSAGTLVPSVARGTARATVRLYGTVRDSAGRGLGGARVSIWGTVAAAVAGADGAFALVGLPAGTRTVEVRAIGFAPRRVAVDLAAGRDSRLDIPMGSAIVPTLGPVTVYGTAVPLSSTDRDFLQRQRTSAFGRFLTAADLLRLQPPTMTWALRQMPGLKLAPNGRLGSAVIGRTYQNGYPADCPAQVVVDGLPLEPGDDVDQFVTPGRVAGVEVYIDQTYAPPQYSGPKTNGCSVVLLWTRR